MLTESKGRYEFAATSVGDYALFGGEYNSGSVLSDVDAYSTNLTHSTPTVLDERRHRFTATANKSYALFGGGERYSSETDYYPNVDAYNADLVHSTATDLSEGRSRLAATTVGDYSLFAGGRLTGGFSSDKVDAYDNNLAQSTATALSLDRASLVATTVGEHAIFASGVKWTLFSSDVFFRINIYHLLHISQDFIENRELRCVLNCSVKVSAANNLNRKPYLYVIFICKKRVHRIPKSRPRMKFYHPVSNFYLRVMNLSDFFINRPAPRWTAKPECFLL